MCTCPMRSEGIWIQSWRSVYWSATHMNIKGYKCYIPQPKQVRVTRDVVFNESASWYLPSTPTPNSNLITEDAASEPETNREEEDEVGDFGILEEGLILFRMSGPNESPIRNDQSDEDLASSGDSAVYSLRR